MRYAHLFTVLFVSIALACGGGGSGDSSGGVVGGGGGGSSNVAGSFTPGAQNPGANTVYLTGTTGSGANNSLVTLHVNVSNTSDVFGASFDVQYDPTMAQFVNWGAGDLLEFGGQSVAYQVNATQPGRLVVGVARTSGGVGVTTTGVRRLIDLTLRVTRAGNSQVAFLNASLLDSQNPPQTKQGISFFGGTLSAN